MTPPPPDSPKPSPDAPPMQPRRRIALAPPREPAPDAAPSPGFALIDDAGGRFCVDPDFGVVSLADESLLEHEPGAVHTVTLRVTEPTGAHYDLTLQLRLTGRIPQIDGSTDFAVLAGMTGDAAPAPRPLRAAAWAQFAAAHGVRRKCPLCGEAAPFGALIAAPLPAGSATAPASLTLAQDLPRPAARDAAWPS